MIRVQSATFPFPICTLLHGCGCCGQSKWMGAMVRRQRDSCLMTLVAFSPHFVAKQANTGVIRRERLCNLWLTQRHFNKLEFMRQCRLCNTFSVMSFAYVYCSCHSGAGGSTEKYSNTPQQKLILKPLGMEQMWFKVVGYCLDTNQTVLGSHRLVVEFLVYFTP